MKHSQGNYSASMTLRFVMSCLFFLYAACSSAQNHEDPIVTIDLEKVIQYKQEINLSRFVDKLEYIPLERTSESALSPIMYSRNVIQLTDDYIIVSNRISSNDRRLLVFDRETGKYIRKIGNVGKGPEEYLNPLNIFYNSFDNKIYTRGDVATIKIYNLDGKFLETFGLPVALEPSLKGGYMRLGIDAFLNADTFIYFTFNETEVMKNQIAIFNRNGEIKYYPPRITWPSKYSTVNYAHFYKPPIFFSREEKLYVKAATNDTIFNITTDRLIPRIVLYSGDHRWSSNLLKSETQKLAHSFLAISICESTNYLFFEFRFMYDNDIDPSYFHLCIFDKKTMDVLVCQNDNTPLPALVDDMNGFIPISHFQINNKNELIAVLEAIDIVKWKTQNLAKASLLKDKYPWLNKIDEFDNPVIVIGKCKD